MKAFDKLFKRMSDMFDSMDEAFKEVEAELGSEGYSYQSSNGITIINKGGNVSINGPIRSLTVNDKKVDLK